MKIKTKSRFNLSKKAKIGIAVGAVAVLGITCLVMCSKKDTEDFYTKLDSFTQVENCNFRYVLNVRSEDYEGKDMTPEELEDALNKTSFENDETVEGNKGYEYVGEGDESSGVIKGDQTGNLYKDHIQTEWTTSDGTLAVDWKYPNYELTVTGRVESTNPLTAAVQIEMATDYTDNVMLKAAFIEGKCYFDVLSLKNWLQSAGDANLVALGKQIPEGVVYVVVEEDKLSLASKYAEETEVELSGATDLVNWYRRFVELEKLLNSAIKKGTSAEGLSVDDTRYRLYLSDDSAMSLLKNMKSMINSSGSYYNSYMSALANKGLITEDAVEQMKNEKDNFLTDMQPTWTWINSLTNADMEAMNLKVIGKARDYESSGVAYKEVNLGVNFVLDDIEYVVSLYGCKYGLGEEGTVKVGIPSESIDDVATVDVDFGAMQEYLRYYFKLGDEVPYKSIEDNWSSLEDALLRDFCDLVNKANTDEGLTGVQPVTMYNVISYIKSYANMTDTEANANPAVKFNYNLVQEFLTRVRFTVDDKEDTVVTEKYSASKVNATIDGDVKIEVEAIVPDNPQLLVSTCKLSWIVPEDSEDGTIVDSPDAGIVENLGRQVDLTKFYVLDSKGNRYPCNYHTSLKELGTNFSLEDAPETVVLPLDGSEVSVRLNFVTTAFSEYNLYYDGTDLGKIIQKNN